MTNQQQRTELEQQFLGAVLAHLDSLTAVVKPLREIVFLNPSHMVIRDALAKLSGGRNTTLDTVVSALADAGNLGKVGGGARLASLIEVAPLAYGDPVRLVEDLAAALIRSNPCPTCGQLQPLTPDTDEAA